MSATTDRQQWSAIYEAERARLMVELDGLDPAEIEEIAWAEANDAMRAAEESREQP